MHHVLFSFIDVHWFSWSFHHLFMVLSPILLSFSPYFQAAVEVVAALRDVMHRECLEDEALHGQLPFHAAEGQEGHRDVDQRQEHGRGLVDLREGAARQGRLTLEDALLPAAAAEVRQGWHHAEDVERGHKQHGEPRGKAVEPLSDARKAWRSSGHRLDVHSSRPRSIIYGMKQA